MFHSFIFSFSFCFALFSEDFLGTDICLCGNNVGIVIEINLIFIGLCKKAGFVNPTTYQSKYLSSKLFKQTKTFDGKLLLSLLIAANQLFSLCGSLGKLK